jgi:hypothetical protein
MFRSLIVFEDSENIYNQILHSNILSERVDSRQRDLGLMTEVK